MTTRTSDPDEFDPVGDDRFVDWLGRIATGDPLDAYPEVGAYGKVTLRTPEGMYTLTVERVADPRDEVADA